jgi:short-chain fatty acids transporter
MGDSTTSTRRRGLQAVAPLFVGLFERVMPDPFVLAIGLTALVAVLALLIAPKGTPEVILSSWYAGIFNILGFAFQMISPGPRRCKAVRVGRYCSDRSSLMAAG